MLFRTATCDDRSLQAQEASALPLHVRLFILAKAVKLTIYHFVSFIVVLTNGEEVKMTYILVFETIFLPAFVCLNTAGWNFDGTVFYNITQYFFLSRNKEYLELITDKLTDGDGFFPRAAALCPVFALDLSGSTSDGGKATHTRTARLLSAIWGFWWIGSRTGLLCLGVVLLFLHVESCNNGRAHHPRFAA